jgi:lipoprotein-anchoring transpeptidase ErfK/SrfK
MSKLTRFRHAVRAVACLAAALSFSNCSSTSSSSRELAVSVKDQKMALIERGQVVRVYGVSTSKFGLGDTRNSNQTPIGKMRVAKKIGGGMPPGMVFKSRQPTGEILRPNAPGRDPIVSRILWLNGAESKTANAYGRFIYIHGTPEERLIGRPASYGCIRMRSMDVIDLYNRVPVGTPVRVTKSGLPMEAKSVQEYVYTPPVRPAATEGPRAGSGEAMAKR